MSDTIVAASGSRDGTLVYPGLCSASVLACIGCRRNDVMSNKLDTATIDEIKSQISALSEEVRHLGPIADLWQQARDIFQQSSPNVRTALEKSKQIREKIFKLLDEPKCEYDDKVLALVNKLKGIPADQRKTVRRLIGESQRQTLSPYVSRADWLTLEEKSQARLSSGLIIQALILPDNDDPRDVMVSLAGMHVCCSELGFNTAELFDEASTFAGDGVSDVFKKFGKQQGVTLAAYGLKRVDTPNGPRIRQTI